MSPENTELGRNFCSKLGSQIGLVVLKQERCRKLKKKKENSIFRYFLQFLRSFFLKKYFL